MAIAYCISTRMDREVVLKKLKEIWTTKTNPHYVIPTTSVRSGLNLFFQAIKFPPGSEIIMSAINIPDVVHIVHHHGLKIRALDICLTTLEPKLESFKSLINDKTVAVIFAHIFGRWSDIESLINLAHSHNLYFIEDCAEGFCGFSNLGHPQSDISLFSFGVIKYSTSFGGGILKVKDCEIFKQILSIQYSYPIQTELNYLKKILKYFFLFLLLDVPLIIKPGMHFTRFFNLDHKTFVINHLRAFPTNLIQQISYQPSSALLRMMLYRFINFDQSDFNLSHLKGEYVSQRLPNSVKLIGTKCKENNHWLFPILVEDAETVVQNLNYLGIDAYRGATQLTVIESDSSEEETDHTIIYSEAHYLIDHVIYLPVNKTVPFHHLDKICQAVSIATASHNSHNLSKFKAFSKL